jgi:hypothetical protein
MLADVYIAAQHHRKAYPVRRAGTQPHVVAILSKSDYSYLVNMLAVVVNGWTVSSPGVWQMDSKFLKHVVLIGAPYIHQKQSRSH